jgi:hypothetical protein
MALVWLVTLGGCASGEISDGEECSGTDDCPAEMNCVEGICTAPDAAPTADLDGGEPDVRPPEDGVVDPRDAADVQIDATGEDVEPRADSGDVEADGSEVDTGPSGCGGACGAGEICEDGECVSRCQQPSCRNDQQCADIGNGPRCYETCSEANSVEECREGELCRDLLGGEDDELLICMPSQCSTNEECRSGTCINGINDYGRCVASGPKAVGEACDLASRGERCKEGAYCIRESSQDTTGTCRKLCDPWADSPSCGSDAYCGLFKQRSGGLSVVSFRQGYCNPSIESERTPPFETCSADANMCTDAVRCVGTSGPVCIKWCRPGEGDCSGTAPPRFSTSATCNNYVFGGLRRLGRCEPQCSTGGDCPDGQTCRQGLCRRTCTSAADCCDATPCQFECNNGLCE